MLRLPLPQADFAPRYNIAPAQLCRTVIADPGGGPRWAESRWGLARSPGGQGLHVNARSETVAELPRFAHLYAESRARCLVPADGYFEWRKEGRIRQPYYFTLPDGRPFCFAGLREPRSPDQPDGTFLILTTDANESTRNVHHRMPVLLPESEFDRWLTGTPEDATRALEAKSSPSFAKRAVSQRVNQVANDDPECVSEGRTQSVLFDL